METRAGSVMTSKSDRTVFLITKNLTYSLATHYSRYKYSVAEFNSTAKGLKDGSRRNGDGGQTATPALYAQADDLAEKWTATFGVPNTGEQQTAGTTAEEPLTHLFVKKKIYLLSSR